MTVLPVVFEKNAVVVVRGAYEVLALTEFALHLSRLHWPPN